MNDRIGWEKVADIEIRSRISVSDTSYFFDTPVLVPVPGGFYSVSVCYHTCENFRHIGSLRMLMAGATVSKRGNMIGTVVVDFGQIGICDRDTVESAFDVLGDGGMHQYYDQLNTTDLLGWVCLPKSARMLTIRPGFGDGSYSVWALTGMHGATEGIEISFMQDLV